MSSSMRAVFLCCRGASIAQKRQRGGMKMGAEEEVRRSTMLRHISGSVKKLGRQADDIGEPLLAHLLDMAAREAHRALAGESGQRPESGLFSEPIGMLLARST
jgi:hypothetical protein